MKLWEYVLKYDKRNKGLKAVCTSEEIDCRMYLISSYCPGVFNCFQNTEFQYSMYPKGNKKENQCKYGNNTDFYLDKNYYETKEKMEKAFNKQFKICIGCWEREIIDKNIIDNIDNNNEEYQLYLKLKEKYER